MNIQIIGYKKEEIVKNIKYSLIATPESLDVFDLNIIDLSNEEIWYTQVGGNLKCKQDLVSLSVMIKNTKTTKVLFVLPQDISFYEYKGETYKTGIARPNYNQYRLKDVLSNIENLVYKIFSPYQNVFETLYENTTTIIRDISYKAAFYFTHDDEVICTSEGSNKPTLISIDENTYITTLDIFASEEKLNHFITAIFDQDQREPAPSWIKDYPFFDDEVQKAKIEEQEQIIITANTTIEEAKERIDLNNRTKSILYTNGSELVEEVLYILGDIFDYDFSEFIDRKQEDFLMKKEGYTLIGEIKGIGSNVRNANVSQLEIHYQKYMDKLADEGKTENVHQVLIINPFRKIPIDEREPVHINQIQLAERNGSLIIETHTLLKLYELFLNQTITATKCKELFTERTGLLKLE